MKSFDVKKIRITGAVLAIGAAGFLSTQAFADAVPATDPALVLPATPVISATTGIAVTSEVADNEEADHQVGNHDEGDVADVSDDADEDSDDEQAGNYDDEDEDASDVAETEDSVEEDD